MTRRAHDESQNLNCLTIDEDRHLQPAGLPNDSRFKGYQDHVVQELVIRAHTLRYRRERWLTPDGCGR